MITVRPHPNTLFAMRASADGIVVFLDLFAIKELAKGDPGRRKRFIATLDRGVDVLFLVSNAAELSGPQGHSFDKIRSFLDEIGTHWFPAEFDPLVCIKRERHSSDPGMCCFNEHLLKAYTATRIKRSPEINERDLPASLPPDFFRLGLFMDWLAPQREELAKGKAELGKRLRDHIMKHRAEYDKDPRWMQSRFPDAMFREHRRATFVYGRLMKLLIQEAKERVFVPNDGIDFCQAVIATAYATVATLDKHWKRRIEMILPNPNPLAKIYYGQELDRMVCDIERHLDNVALSRGRTVCSFD